MFAIDSSEATMKLQHDTYLTVARQTCSLKQQAQNAIGTGEEQNETTTTILEVASSWEDLEDQVRLAGPINVLAAQLIHAKTAVNA